MSKGINVLGGPPLCSKGVMHAGMQSMPAHMEVNKINKLVGRMCVDTCQTGLGRLNISKEGGASCANQIPNHGVATSSSGCQFEQAIEGKATNKGMATRPSNTNAEMRCTIQ